MHLCGLRNTCTAMLAARRAISAFLCGPLKVIFQDPILILFGCECEFAGKRGREVYAERALIASTARLIRELPASCTGTTTLLQQGRTAAQEDKAQMAV